MKNYILIENRGIKAPLVLGFFSKIINAKRYAGEVGLKKEQCAIYEVSFKNKWY